MGIKQPTPSPGVGRAGLSVHASVPATLTMERWESVVTMLTLFPLEAWVLYHMIKRLLGLLCVEHQVLDPSFRNGGTGSGPFEARFHRQGRCSMGPREPRSIQMRVPRAEVLF